MSVMPTAREVLAHLNYLGYTNINAYQLKDFMTDLKRFIKYEEQCARHQPDKREAQPEEDYPDYPERDVFESLHQTDTVASKAKKKAKPSCKPKPKEHIITVHLQNACQQTEVPKLVIPQDSDEMESEKCPKCQCSQVQLTAPQNSSNTESVARSVPSTSKSVPSLQIPTATGTATSLDTGIKKTRTKSARSSFIKPKVINKPLKSDPVALYHQYKQEWDKIKFPGENPHIETRWAVREKLLGEL